MNRALEVGFFLLNFHDPMERSNSNIINPITRDVRSPRIETQNESYEITSGLPVTEVCVLF